MARARGLTYRRDHLSRRREIVMRKGLGLVCAVIVLVLAPLATQSFAGSTSVVTLLDNAVVGPTDVLFPPEVATKGFKEITLYGTSSGGAGALEVLVTCWFLLEAGTDPITGPSLLATVGYIPTSNPLAFPGGFRIATQDLQGVLNGGSLKMPVPVVAPFYRCRVNAPENATVTLKLLLNKKRTD